MVVVTMICCESEYCGKGVGHSHKLGKNPLLSDLDSGGGLPAPERPRVSWLARLAFQHQGDQGEDGTLLHPGNSEAINQLGGLSDEGLVPRVFYPKSGATQLSLFEAKVGYSIDTGVEDNLELG